MFTGIVQGLVPVISLETLPSLRRIVLDMGQLAQDIEDGASVAVNGVCLTVVAESEGHVHFDVIQETLDHSSLGKLDEGQLVNVERSYRVGDEIGGHIVSGHIAAAVPVINVDESDNLRNLTFSVPAEWIKYLHLKGFAAFDGASLTLSEVDDSACTASVSLIPETIARTTLGSVRVGGTVNLEVDAQTQTIVETVERALSSPQMRKRLGLDQMRKS